MKKLILIFALMLFMTVAVHANTDIFTTSLLLENDSSCAPDVCYRQQQFIQYDASELNTLQGGELFFFIQYSCEDLEDFNEVNNAFTGISRVDLRLLQTKRISGTNFTTVNETITITNTTPFHSFKKFIRLSDKESLVVAMDTFFSGTPIPDSVCSFQTVLGTRGCDRCNELAFARFEQNVIEVNTLNAFVANIKNRIKQLFEINFEFFVIAYWVILLAILIGVLTLFFWMIFFVFHFIKHFFDRVAKRKRP